MSSRPGHRAVNLSLRSTTIVEKLAREHPHATYAGVVEDAVKLYAVFLDEINRGSEVVFKRYDGSERYVEVIL